MAVPTSNTVYESAVIQAPLAKGASLFSALLTAIRS